jgi:hypothetical protein
MVPLLPLLAASAEQDDEPLSILAEVHAVAWTEVETKFEDSGTYALGHPEVAVLHAQDSGDDTDACRGVQLHDPIPVGDTAERVDVFPHLDHGDNGNSCVTVLQ